MAVIPNWLYGIDSLVELLAMIIAILTSTMSYKIYRLTHQNKYKYFAVAFFFIGLALIERAVMHLVLFFGLNRQIEHWIGLIWSPDMWLMGYAFLMLVAYLIFVILSIKIRKNIVRILYLILITMLVYCSRNFYFVFQIISILFLLIITRHFLHNYLDKRTMSSLMVFLSFLFMIIGHICFILAISMDGFIIGAHFFFLFGYVILFVPIFKVFIK